MPSTVLAATKNSVQLGVDIIKYGDTVYYNNGGSWFVIGTNGTVKSNLDTNPDSMFLFSKYCTSYCGWNDYHTELDSVYSGFSSQEKGAVKDTTLSGSSIISGQSDLTGQKLFLLSLDEVKIIGIYNSMLVNDNFWWLRTLFNAEYAYDVNGRGYLSDKHAQILSNSNGVRPAFNLNLSSVLFTSAADNRGHNATLASTSAYSGNEWKLTLKDSNSFAAGASIDKSAVVAGNKVTINHAALSSFTDAGYTNVTAMLTDSNGKVLYYGSVNDSVNATSTTVTVPGLLESGNYTLSLYGEDWNAPNNTDYATGTPYSVTLEVTESPEYAYNTPTEITQNGVTASVTCSPESPRKPSTSVTATVTLTGTAAKAGIHTFNLNSAKAGFRGTAQKIFVSEEQDLTAAPVTKTFTFTMPAENLDDLTLTHTFTDYWTATGNYDASWLGDYNNTSEWAIYDEKDLAAFSVAVNAGNSFENKTVKLLSDLCLDGKLWSPIGTIDVNTTGPNEGETAVPFMGTFDGCGHTVSHMTVFAEKNVGGMFGYVLNGDIKNVSVEDGTVTGIAYAEKSVVVCGGVAAIIEGVAEENAVSNLSDCYYTGTVATEGTFSAFAGGIAGIANYTNISGCRNTGTISATDEFKSFPGGLVGHGEGVNITDCLNFGSVTAYGNKVVSSGGIIGNGYSAHIIDCSNTGSVIAKDNNIASMPDDADDKYLCASGGMAGVLAHDSQDASNIANNCCNTGTIIASDSAKNCVGGIVGDILVGENEYSLDDIILSNCCNIATVNAYGTKENFAGGVAGSNSKGFTITNCYNTGDVTADSGTVNSVGGVTGNNTDINMSNCYSLDDCIKSGNIANGKSGTSLHSSQMSAAVVISNVNTWADITVEGSNKGKVSLVTALNFGADAFNGKDPSPLYQAQYWRIKTTENAGYPTPFGADTTAPILTAGTVNRGNDTDATVTFTSDEAGIYYYAVTDSDVTAPDIDTTATGLALGEGEQTISLSHLSAGVKYIYIVAKDLSGNVSDRSFKIAIPAYKAQNLAIYPGTSPVTFISAADNSGHNVVFAAPDAYDGDGWKLTLKDANSFSSAANISKTSVNAGETITVTHAALSSLSESYTNVTAAIMNANGDLLYYGSLNNDTSATASGITIPEELAVGSYTLSVYGEDWNEPGSTDYATGTPFSVALNVGLSDGWTATGEYDTSWLGSNYDTGTAWTIYDEKDLKAFAVAVNSGKSFEGKTVALAADLYLPSGSWTPIGSIDTPFSGTFNGNNYKISNLNIVADKSNMGFFGCISNAVIKDLSVSGKILCTANDISNIGGIVGLTNKNSTLQSLYSSVNITNNSNTLIKHIGGVLGATYDKNSKTDVTLIYGCTYSGNLRLDNSDDCIGGVVGYINAHTTIENCTNTGLVEATKADAFVGGILGYVNTSTTRINSCINIGTVKGSGNYCGAIIGWLRSGGVDSTSYYLNNMANGIGAVGSDSRFVSKSDSAFASGEVCYLLNGGVTDGTQRWYQNINNAAKENDGYPKLSGETVYSLDLVYSNSPYISSSNDSLTRLDLTGNYIITKAQALTSLEVLLHKIPGGTLEGAKTGSFWGTGNIVKAKNNNSEKAFTLIILGDLNGDGVCDVLDCMLAELLQNGNFAPDKNKMIAADENTNGEIDVYDYQQIINKALSK